MRCDFMLDLYLVLIIREVEMNLLYLVLEWWSSFFSLFVVSLLESNFYLAEFEQLSQHIYNRYVLSTIYLYLVVEHIAIFKLVNVASCKYVLVLELERLFVMRSAC